MATESNIENYYKGEPFVLTATLTDADGDPVISGTMKLQFSTSPEAKSVLDVTGTHTGAGVWQFEAGILPLSHLGYYEVQDGDGYIYLRGSVRINSTIF